MFLSNVGTVVPVGLVTVRVTFPPTPTVGVTVPPILSLFKIFGMVRVDVFGITVKLSGVTVIVGVTTFTVTVVLVQLLLLAASHIL